MDFKNWSIHAEFVVIFITLVGGFFLLDGKIDRQVSGTDRLYEMYCDTQNRMERLDAEYKSHMMYYHKE